MVVVGCLLRIVIPADKGKNQVDFRNEHSAVAYREEEKKRKYPENLVKLEMSTHLRCIVNSHSAGVSNCGCLPQECQYLRLKAAGCRSPSLHSAAVAKASSHRGPARVRSPCCCLSPRKHAAQLQDPAVRLRWDLSQTGLRPPLSTLNRCPITKGLVYKICEDCERPRRVTVTLSNGGAELEIPTQGIRIPQKSPLLWVTTVRRKSSVIITTGLSVARVRTWWRLREDPRALRQPNTPENY